MQNFIKKFVREGAGQWACVEPAEIRLPQGRVQVNPGTRFTLGSKFMGVELAALLEDEYRKSGRGPG